MTSPWNTAAAGNASAEKAALTGGLFLFRGREKLF